MHQGWCCKMSRGEGRMWKFIAVVIDGRVWRGSVIDLDVLPIFWLASWDDGKNLWTLHQLINLSRTVIRCISTWHGGVSEEIISADDANAWARTPNSELSITSLSSRVLWVRGDSILRKELRVFLAYPSGINIWKRFSIMVVSPCLRKVFVYLASHEAALLWSIASSSLTGFEVRASDLWTLAEACFGRSVDSGCPWGCCDTDEAV